MSLVEVTTPSGKRKTVGIAQDRSGSVLSIVVLGATGDLAKKVIMFKGAALLHFRNPKTTPCSLLSLPCSLSIHRDSCPRNFMLWVSAGSPPLANRSRLLLVSASICVLMLARPKPQVCFQKLCVAPACHFSAAVSGPGTDEFFAKCRFYCRQYFFERSTLYRCSFVHANYDSATDFAALSRHCSAIEEQLCVAFSDAAASSICDRHPHRAGSEVHQQKPTGYFTSRFRQLRLLFLQPASMLQQEHPMDGPALSLRNRSAAAANLTRSFLLLFRHH
jgi:hypothetical protein